MISFEAFRPAPEHRADPDPVDATNVLIQAFQTYLSATPQSPLGLGPVEACAGQWARGLVAAELSGLAAEVCTADVRNHIGRQLVRTGDVVYAIVVRDGRPRIYPASTVEVSGRSADPDDWFYTLELSTPNGGANVFLPSQSVLHFQYATLPGAPWRGVGPLDLANRSGELAAQLERSLAEEASGPAGFLLPLPEGQAGADTADGTEEGSEADPAAVLMGAIRTLKGQVKAVESLDGGYGDRGQAPASDFGLKRVGAEFTPTQAALQTTMVTVVCGACGVPPALVAGLSDGTAMRESWRRFLHGTMAPVGRMLLAEIRRKLDPTAEVSWAELAAADVAGRARAWRALVGREAAMPDADARKIVGIDVPVTEPQRVIQEQADGGE